MAEQKNKVSNDVKSGDFLRVLLTLKQNIMRNLHVADVCQITSVKTDENGIMSYMCKAINNSELSFYAYACSNLILDKDDYVLVLFCDDDFRINYRKIKTNQQPQLVNSEQKHIISYGIIIGKI